MRESAEKSRVKKSYIKCNSSIQGTSFGGLSGSLGTNTTDSERVFLGNGTDKDMNGSNVTDTYKHNNNYK